MIKTVINKNLIYYKLIFLLILLITIINIYIPAIGEERIKVPYIHLRHPKLALKGTIPFNDYTKNSFKNDIYSIITENGFEIVEDKDNYIQIQIKDHNMINVFYLWFITNINNSSFYIYIDHICCRPYIFSDESEPYQFSNVDWVNNSYIQRIINQIKRIFF